MKIEIQTNSHANITFNTLAKVAIKGNQSYLVKWFCDNVLVGEMDLNSGMWGGFENQIGNWRIEFYQNSSLVHTYYHNLLSTNILILPRFQSETRGKLPNLYNIQRHIEEIESKYGCVVYVFFVSSEKFDLGFKTLKMNDNIDFSLIIEKDF